MTVGVAAFARTRGAEPAFWRTRLRMMRGETTVSYALITLWHERQRYLPGVLVLPKPFDVSQLLEFVSEQCG